MSEISAENHERNTQPPLDREQAAINLRELGIDIDLKDWDELDDNDVLGEIASAALMHDFDVEDVLKEAAFVEEFGAESVDVRHIISVLRSFGVTTLDEATLAKLDVTVMQRTAVWHIKEVTTDFETIGRLCFGNNWQEGRWQ